MFNEEVSRFDSGDELRGKIDYVRDIAALSHLQDVLNRVPHEWWK